VRKCWRSLNASRNGREPSTLWRYKLTQQSETVQALIDHVGQRQGAVESLAIRLAERHERVLELVEHVGERQSAVDSLAVELDASHKKVIH